MNGIFGNSFAYGTYAGYGNYTGYNSLTGGSSGSVSGVPGLSGDESKIQGLPGNSEDDGRINGLPGSSDEDNKIKVKGEGDGPNGECETCKHRKYQDGSNEMVSYKSAAHIDPQAAASAVRGHEQEHVSNAYKKAATDNGRVINASVSIHTAVCPECGRTYVSGGTTNTQIKYYNEDNPYQKSMKSGDRTKYEGMNYDLQV